jgi:hypothetical protein
MTVRTMLKLVVILWTGVMLCFASTSPALAAAKPPNDNFNKATVITQLGFMDTLNTSGATTGKDDPVDCGNSGSVWYAYTPPVNMTIEAKTAGSNYPTALSVYTSSGGNLIQVPGACSIDYPGGSRVLVNATAGTTYYFLVAFCCGYTPSTGSTLLFSAQEIARPVNDNFANAITSPLLPFTHDVDVSAATKEPGEPAPSCADPSSFTGSVWYAFTATTRQLLMAQVYNVWPPFIAAYTGSSLGNLTQVGCNAYGSQVAFQAIEGTTYYFQAGSLYGSPGRLHFSLNVPPPPDANFYYSTWSPSIYDNVQFYGWAYDPVGMPIILYEWDFGDGTTATGDYVFHQYAADGVYLVTYKVTTSDGRTASTTQQVTVETHDVAITKFTTPQTASVGQTRQIEVGVSSKLNAETVEVQLFKSIPGGYQYVGTLIQSIPVRSANRTTDFSFSYTFTQDDAKIGKVTFKATANILYKIDAIPADNEAVSSPTTVSGKGGKSGSIEIEAAAEPEVLQAPDEVAEPAPPQEQEAPQPDGVLFFPLIGSPQ